MIPILYQKQNIEESWKDKLSNFFLVISEYRDYEGFHFLLRFAFFFPFFQLST